MSEWPRRCSSWECSDGKSFTTKRVAADYERALGAAAEAQPVLDRGGAVGDALRVFYEHTHGHETADRIIASVDPAVLALTTRSGLVVSHWQCIDRPIYTIRKVLPSGSFLVWGTEPGPLGNTYGGEVSVRDLESYVRQTIRRCGNVPEAPC